LTPIRNLVIYPGLDVHVLSALFQETATLILPRNNSAAGAKKKTVISLTGRYSKVLHQVDQLDPRKTIPAKVRVGGIKDNDNSLFFFQFRNQEQIWGESHLAVACETVTRDKMGSYVVPSNGSTSICKFLEIKIRVSLM